MSLEIRYMIGLSEGNFIYLISVKIAGLCTLDDAVYMYSKRQVLVWSNNLLDFVYPFNTNTCSGAVIYIIIFS